jgi:uncharacterized LabA/DUF88 family protein
MPTAVLIDGGFFQKRYRALYDGAAHHDPHSVAKNLFTLALKHVDQEAGEKLYRIFYYDCPPFAKKLHNPITGRLVDFSKTAQADFQLRFFEELKKLRKVALRRGEIRDRSGWTVEKSKLMDLLRQRIKISDLTEADVKPDIVQKGVDMRIGLDIAALAFKRLADKIVLISGDSDFVPAAKLARREGIDFVLDPMWNPINPDLHEHIDGLQSYSPRPRD